MNTSEPVVYPDDWVCRGAWAEFGCSRRGIWRVTSHSGAPYEPEQDMEWTDYLCSHHLVGFLHDFCGNRAVMVDRQRQGIRTAKREAP